MKREAFGPWLKQRRKELDLTQADLARRVECTTATIRKREAGTRRPSKLLLERLADALDISPEQRVHFIHLARAASEDESSASFLSRSSPSQSPLYHLPALTTPLIGRVQDVFAVRHMLGRDTVRLLTIVGPPGIGKTRLSLQAARELHQTFADGVAFPALVEDGRIQPDGRARVEGNVDAHGRRPATLEVIFQIIG